MANSTHRNDIGDCLVIIRKRSRQNLLTGCMEWFGLRNKKGYGYIRCEGKMRSIHRIIYEANIGPIPKGLHVLHACDNPNCCEPLHLFLGTNEENIKDKMHKDRSGKKLCIDDVKQIKTSLALGELQDSIAEKFGVHQCIISRINTGARWSHVCA